MDKPDGDTTVDTHVTIVRPIPGLFFNTFFGYMMIKIESEITAAGEGASGQTELARTKLENSFNVSYPNCREEQKRIVAILDKVFADIEKIRANTEQNLKNARELFGSVLGEKLANVANSENVQSLSDLTDLIVDCEHKTAPSQASGKPSIRTPNIGKGELLLDGVYRVNDDVYETWTRRAKPRPGDLILAREAPAGNVGVIPEGETVCLGQRTVLIRPKESEVFPLYLAFLMLHPILHERLLSKSSGATVTHVNMRDIRSLDLPPLPNLTQQKIDARLIEEAREKLKRLEAISLRKLEEIDELKKSILQKAFSGELSINDKGVAA